MQYKLDAEKSIQFDKALNSSELDALFRFLNRKLGVCFSYNVRISKEVLTNHESENSASRETNAEITGVALPNQKYSGREIPFHCLRNRIVNDPTKIDGIDFSVPFNYTITEMPKSELKFFRDMRREVRNFMEYSWLFT